jgi:hypothetical protein
VALLPVSEAVQLLARDDAVNASLPEALRPWIVVALVTAPLAPSEPWLLIMIWPELKKVAGPAEAFPVAALAVRGLFDASVASVTDGVAVDALQV